MSQWDLSFYFVSNCSKYSIKFLWMIKTCITEYFKVNFSYKWVGLFSIEYASFSPLDQSTCIQYLGILISEKKIMWFLTLVGYVFRNNLTSDKIKKNCSIILAISYGIYFVDKNNYCTVWMVLICMWHSGNISLVKHSYFKEQHNLYSMLNIIKLLGQDIL